MEYKLWEYQDNWDEESANACDSWVTQEVELGMINGFDGEYYY